MKTIRVSEDDLNAAAKEGLLTHKEAGPLWTYLSSLHEEPPAPATADSGSGFNLGNLAAYSGAALIMAAMVWVITQVWSSYQGPGLVAASLLYTAIFAGTGLYFWGRENTRTPGGILVTLAVAMTPVTIFGIEHALGAFSSGASDGPRWLMEIGTVVVGLAALRFVRFPFVAAPVAVALWLLSLDVAQSMAGHNMTWQGYNQITMAFGMLMVVGSFIVDRFSREDFAFWGYLLGTFSAWVAGTILVFDAGSESVNLLYAGVNGLMMIASVLLQRRVLLVFGSVGVSGYVGYLLWELFKNSMMFPVALTVLGIGLVFLSIYYARNRASIENAILGLVPVGLRKSLPGSRS
jgi:hypothetical protein